MVGVSSGPGPTDAVVLDVGGVFFVPETSWLVESLTAAGIAVELPEGGLLRAHYHGIRAVDEVMARPNAASGDFEAAYLGAVAREVGVPDDCLGDAVATLAQAWKVPASEVWTEPVPGSIEGLRALAAAGLGLAVVSNSDGTVEEKLRSAGVCQVGRGDGVEVAAVVDSHVAGVSKPDPRIFEPALSALDHDASRVAYVGDSLHYDVGGARRAGMWPVHFDPFALCADSDHHHVASLSGLREVIDCRVG